jgi:glycosyltransferase involved in cell wall biosynthesis
MRILFLCGREIEYPRNLVILQALQQLGVVDLIAEHGSAHSLTLRNIRVMCKAFPRLLFSKYDLIFIGFYGYFLILESRLLNRAPILFDAFISNYDTLVSDRKKITTTSPIAQFLRWLDITACRSSNRILLDTHENISYFVREFGLPMEKFEKLPVGNIDDFFYPSPTPPHNHCLRILYYCTYLPLHGTPVIIEAANRLKDLDFELIMIGNGPEYSYTRELAAKYDLNNIIFMDPMPLENLANEVRRADICLGGHFGNSPKAGRTIPSKIYQMLASGKPIIASKTPANLELLVHLENAYLCALADPTSLSLAIKTLYYDKALRERLAENGLKTYLATANKDVIVKRMYEIIQKTLL